MRKSDVKKLRKGQRVYYGGYEWKVHQTVPYVKGIGRKAEMRLKDGVADGYYIWLKAIDGEFYPLGGQYRPTQTPLDKQYWLGVEANYKDVEIKKETK